MGSRFIQFHIQVTQIHGDKHRSTLGLGPTQIHIGVTQVYIGDGINTDSHWDWDEHRFISRWGLTQIQIEIRINSFSHKGKDEHKYTEHKYAFRLSLTQIQI